MILEIECLPSPAGTPDNRHAFIESAIAVIQRSGLKYEVEPLGTTVEGAPDEIWALCRAVHEACLAAGAESLVSLVKFYQAREDAPQQHTMGSLVSKFR